MPVESFRNWNLSFSNMKHLLTRTTALLALMAAAAFSHADEITSQLDNGLTVAADYYEGDSDGPAFVVMHGTWAHHSMELPTYLTELLDYEGKTVLNISLSLGLSNREGFLDCAQDPVLGAQQDAVTELNHWFDWLKNKGFSEVVLIAHSRGGAQSALFAQQTQHPMLKQLALIAPASWDKGSIEKGYQQRFNTSIDEILNKFATLGDNDRLDQIGVLYCDSGTVDKRTFVSYYTAVPEKNTPTLLQQIDVSTVVYLGSEDEISLRFAEQQDDLSGADHVDVLMIDGADHFFRDLYADEIIEDLLERI
jgi:pimeloyl-ACP methyl ester carboxylesterase